MKTQILSFTHSRINESVEQSHFSFSLFFVSFFSKCLFEETLKEELEKNLNTCSYLCSGNELWVHSITFTICLEKEGRKEGLGLKMEWTLLNKKQLGVEGNVGLLREGLKTWKSSWIQLFLSVDKLLSLR